MKKLRSFDFDPYMTRIGRVFALVLIGLGALFYWKVGIGANSEEKMTAFFFGTLPIFYGVVVGVISLLPDREIRTKRLKKMVGIPLAFAGAALITALIVTALTPSP